MHLNPNQNCEYRCNSLNNFHLHRFTKNSSAFRCSKRREHLNSAKMQIQALNPLISNALQDFQRQYLRFRCSMGRKWEGKAAKCKSAPQASPERVSPKDTANLPMHLNLNENREYRCNSLNNFHLHRFTKNSSAFRCTGKQQHLNFDKMRIQAPSMLTSSVLKEFQQPYPRFRCSVGRKHRRVQTRPTGTSGKGLTERHHKPPHASEPEQKPQI